MKLPRMILCVLLTYDEVVERCVSGGPISETDQPHDSAETAMTILPGETYWCLLLNDSDEDWYQVTFPQEVKANKPYFVRVSGDSGAGSAIYTLRARLLSLGD